MENDPDIHREDYFENVFTAISLDGKLPYITDGVGVSTMLADGESMNGKTGWTLQDLEELLNTYGADSVSNLSGAFFSKLCSRRTTALLTGLQANVPLIRLNS